MMELKRLLTRATALLFQGAYQGAESFIEQAMAEADKIKSELAELDTLRTRVTEMASEVERLQSVIDEANAQEPVRYEYFNEHFGRWFPCENENEANRQKEVGRKTVALYARPIPTKQSVDRQSIIDVLVASGSLSEGVTADLIIGAIGAKPQHTILIGRDEWRSETHEQQSPAVAVPEPSELDVYRWFQESTIAHHIEEDGGHFSKRAMFLAKKAIAFAQQSPRITEQDAMISGSDIYLFRRKGLEPFLTCSRERFDELSRNESFETKILYENALISAPFPHPRISEHELKLIAQSAVEYYSDHGWREGDKFWMENKGSALLNKLNGDHNGK